jgi:hypothetical protein
VRGAIKEAPYEGFSAQKIVRSPILGAVNGVVLRSVFPGANSVLLFLSSVALERFTVEAYKVARAQGGTYVAAKFVVGEWGRPLPQLPLEPALLPYEPRYG